MLAAVDVITTRKEKIGFVQKNVDSYKALCNTLIARIDIRYEENLKHIQPANSSAPI